MNIPDETRLEKEKYRLFILLSLISLCCFLTFYSNLVLHTTSVYTHFFYIPVFFASLWWEKKGTALVLCLAFFLLVTHNLIISRISYIDYLRIGIFSAIGIFLSISIEKIRPVNRSLILNTFSGIRINALKESSKISLITVLVFISCTFTVYFHLVENRGTIFSHFFYIPIILSAFWWKRRGLPVAVFLASFLLFSHFFLRDYTITINDYFRAAMFIIVPLVVSFFGEKISTAEKKVNYLSLIVDLVQNVNRLVMQEFDRLRLSEGIAAAIADNPGCDSVNIILYNEKGEPEETITRYNSSKSLYKNLSENIPHCCRKNKSDTTSPSVLNCSECGKCKNHSSSSFCYMLEHDGFIYGKIFVLLSGDYKHDSEQLFLLKSISDELAYALYNLNVEKTRKKAEEEIRIDEHRIRTIAEFSKFTGASFEDMSRFALKETMNISKSETGYIAFINDENQCVDILTLEPEININSNLQAYKSLCDMNRDGVISTAVSASLPVISEDAGQLNKISSIYHRKDRKLKKHIDIPVFDSSKVSAVVGLGNSLLPYGESLIKNITLLMQGMWIILQHRKAEDELARYRDNLREMVKIRTEELEYTNHRLTLELREKDILNKNLEESTRELESFVHTVTHDLKSPLFSIKLCADMLNRDHAGRMDIECLELLKQIKKESFRMEELIKDVLTLSRVGVDCDKIEEIDILKLILDISGRFDHFFDENSVEFVIKILLPEPLPVILAIKSQVIQVLENLLTNAVKFMGDEEDPCIVLCFESVNNDFCHCYVEDNGIGIAEKDHEKIFAEFYRTHDVDVEGTGIGLAIVKK
jgi:signal transduction histidine kinase